MDASKRGALGAAVIATGLLMAPPTRAQGTNTALAEALFREGKQLMTDGKFDEACPKIAESQRLDPGTGTLLNLAACHEAAGKIASAWAEFGEAASLARRDGRADREQFASAHALALEPKLPRLALDIAPEALALTSLEIHIDDVVVGRVAWSVPEPIDPGNHVIMAFATGKKQWSFEVTVPATPDVQKVSIPALEEAPRAPAAPGATAPGAAPAPGADGTPKSHGNGRAVGLAVGAAGVVAIGVGSFFGLQAFSKWHERNQHCPAGACDDVAVADSTAAHTDAHIADVAMGLGIVGLGVGAYLFFTAPASPAPDQPHGGLRTWVSVGAISPVSPGVTAGGVF